MTFENHLIVQDCRVALRTPHWKVANETWSYLKRVVAKGARLRWDHERVETEMGCPNAHKHITHQRAEI